MFRCPPFSLASRGMARCACSPHAHLRPGKQMVNTQCALTQAMFCLPTIYMKERITILRAICPGALQITGSTDKLTDIQQYCISSSQLLLNNERQCVRLSEGYASVYTNTLTWSLSSDFSCFDLLHPEMWRGECCALRWKQSSLKRFREMNYSKHWAEENSAGYKPTAVYLLVHASCAQTRLNQI